MTRTITTAIAALAAASAITLLAYAHSAFKNEELTRSAWRFLNEKNYPSAIEKAEECVRLFHDEAIKEQSELQKQGVPLPAKGIVSEKEAKDVIFKRGLINDVATCWFILGKAQAGQGNKDKAEKAFQKVMLFPYARCYDPSNDSFWAPVDGAQAELKELSGKSLYD